MTLDELRDLVDSVSYLSGDMKLVRRDRITGRLLEFSMETETVFVDEKQKMSSDENDEQVLLVWS